MPANIKQIKSRIRSVDSTMHITKAMELVASSKFRKAVLLSEQGKPYFNALLSAMAELYGADSDYCREREVKKTCYIFIAGDRGLAGGYNSNIYKMVKSVAKKGDFCVAPIGKLAVDFAQKNGYEIIAKSNTVENMAMADCVKMGAELTAAYKNGEIDKIVVLYTEYVSVLTQTPLEVQILPITEPQEKPDDFVLFEPSCEAVLEAIIPEYVCGMIYNYVGESYASELAARRTAMESASNNASEMIDKLQLKYNRARQSAITQEITEIIGGSAT